MVSVPEFIGHLFVDGGVVWTVSDPELKPQAWLQQFPVEQTLR